MRDKDRREADLRAARRIIHYLRRYRLRLVIGAICLVASNSLLLIDPWILKIAIDSLREGVSRSLLLRYALAFVGVAVASGIFRFLMRRIMIGVSRKIEFDMRQDFFHHLERMSPSFYSRHRTGDLMALATNDLNAVRTLVGPGIMYSLNTAVIGLAAIALMLILSAKLTLVALLPMLLLVGSVYHFVKVIHRLFEDVQQRFAALNSRSQENLSGIRVVKAYAREANEIEQFSRLSLDYVRSNMKLFRVQSLLMPMLTMVAGLGALAILAYGGKLVIDQRLSLGAFVAFNGYLTMLVWPMIALGWVMNMTQRGLASMGRIDRVLEEKPDIVDGRRSRSPSIYSIEFRGVGFTYPGRSNGGRVVEGLSFRVEPGETLAVVGPTGSGKSTLVALLLRLYEPNEGEITIGGVPLGEIAMDELRRLIGVVPQDIFLFSDTVANNIAFGIDGDDQELVERASAAAAVREEILGFPRGFASMIGERGINLSGGQKQRLAIARALAKDPKILVLDDALSSVDTETEEKILSRLREEMKRRTTILISHRVSTVQGADRIIVLSEGRIREEGTHRELLARGGIYAEMHRKQLIAADLERGI